jgi:hypothetical protein
VPTVTATEKKPVTETNVLITIGFPPTDAPTEGKRQAERTKRETKTKQVTVAQAPLTLHETHTTPPPLPREARQTTTPVRLLLHGLPAKAGQNCDGENHPAAGPESVPAQRKHPTDSARKDPKRKRGWLNLGEDSRHHNDHPGGPGADGSGERARPLVRRRGGLHEDKRGEEEREAEPSEDERKRRKAGQPRRRSNPKREKGVGRKPQQHTKTPTTTTNTRTNNTNTDSNDTTATTNTTTDTTTTSDNNAVTDTTTNSNDNTTATTSNTTSTAEQISDGRTPPLLTDDFNKFSHEENEEVLDDETSAGREAGGSPSYGPSKTFQLDTNTATRTGNGGSPLHDPSKSFLGGEQAATNASTTAAQSREREPPFHDTTPPRPTGEGAERDDYGEPTLRRREERAAQNGQRRKQARTTKRTERADQHNVKSREVGGGWDHTKTGEWLKGNRAKQGRHPKKKRKDTTTRRTPGRRRQAGQDTNGKRKRRIGKRTSTGETLPNRDSGNDAKRREQSARNLGGERGEEADGSAKSQDKRCWTRERE